MISVILCLVSTLHYHLVLIVIRKVANIFKAYCVMELLMGFLDVVFLPHTELFFATFLKYCGRGESLKTATYLMTVVVGKEGHTHIKNF